MFWATGLLVFKEPKNADSVLAAVEARNRKPCELEKSLEEGQLGPTIEIDLDDNIKGHASPQMQDCTERC